MQFMQVSVDHEVMVIPTGVFSGVVTDAAVRLVRVTRVVLHANVAILWNSDTHIEMIISHVDMITSLPVLLLIREIRI